MRAKRVPGRLMDLRTAAAYLGCSYWTLRDLVVNGYVPAVRIPSPRARDGRALRRTLIDQRDLELLIERWKERNTAASTDRTQPGGRNGDALQTRRSVVDQVLPERARHARIVAQHEGRRRQAPAQIARGRHRARLAGRSEAESNSLRGSGRGPEDGVRGERTTFSRRARATDSPAPDAALRRPSPGNDRDDGHQQIHPDAASSRDLRRRAPAASARRGDAERERAGAGPRERRER